MAPSLLSLGFMASFPYWAGMPSLPTGFPPCKGPEDCHSRPILSPIYLYNFCGLTALQSDPLFNACLVLWAEFHRFRSRLQPFFLIFIDFGFGWIWSLLHQHPKNFLLFALFCFRLGLVITAPAPSQTFLIFVFVFCFAFGFLPL